MTTGTAANGTDDAVRTTDDKRRRCTDLYRHHYGLEAENRCAGSGRWSNPRTMRYSAVHSIKDRQLECGRRKKFGYMGEAIGHPLGMLTQEGPAGEQDELLTKKWGGEKLKILRRPDA